MLGSVMAMFFIMAATDIFLYSHQESDPGKNRKISNTSTFQSGDIVLGGLFPVHKSSKDGCGELRSHDVVQFTQAMIFAIDEVNNDTTLLPDVSLGFQIFDYCSKDVIALQKASIFLNTCPALLDINAPVVGVIGPYSSSIALQVSNLLGLFKIPHISYGATSPLFSDKNRFKFFLRTVPSDRIRALAIAESLAMSGTKYVSVLHSEGDFGHGGAKYFSQEANARGICLALTRELPSVDSSQEIAEAVRALVKKRTAQVVVLFCTKSHIKELLRTTKELGEKDWFLWLIGGDSSETHVYLNGNEDMAENIIIFAPRSERSPAFEDWKGRTDGSRNPWVVELKKKINAKRGKFFNYSMHHDDPPDFVSENGEKFLTASHAQNVIIAVYTFAYALDDLLRTYCVNQVNASVALIPWYFCIQEKASNGEELLRFMKLQSFTSTGRKIRFDESGDIIAEYELLRPMKDITDMWSFTKVAEWNHELSQRFAAPARFVLSNQSQDIFPKTSCTVPCDIGEIKILKDSCCWNCMKCKANEMTVEEYTKCMPCQPGSKVNANRTSCFPLPSYWTDPESAYLTITVCLAAFELLCTLVILTVFILRKDDPVIKASSRGLSCVLLVGVIVSCCECFLVALEPDPPTCTLQRYGCLGYIGCYTVMFSKALRFNRLFNSSLRSSINPTLVSTRSLLILIGSILIVAAVFNTGWGFHSFKDCVVNIYTEEAIVIQCKVSSLESVLRVSWNMILLSLCAFYTFKTRKLPRQFRETKGLTVSIYSTATVQLVVLATICGLNPENLLRGRMILISKPLLILLILVPIFFPKMYEMFYRKGRKSMRSMRDKALDLRAHSGKGSSCRGEMNTPDVLRNPNVTPYSVRSSSESIRGRTKSSPRRSVCSADSRSRATITDTFRSSDETLDVPQDESAETSRPRSETRGYTPEELSPSSVRSVYSTWL